MDVADFKQTRFSVLDLAPVKQGGSIADSFRETRDLAQHVEKLGYTRFWLAEHHNMAAVASAATSVLIGYVAGHTSKIRVGSGGVMLPNHAPLVIAEQFGTLATLYPGRIDLGLGRAPGTDGPTLRALRRSPDSASDFPAQVEELLTLLGDVEPGQSIKAVPGSGTHVPVWLLGSSTFSAQLAAELGLPFAFAAHFAPQQLHMALHLYKTLFQPSRYLRRPYSIACVPLIAADTQSQADQLLTTLQLKFLDIVRGRKDTLLSPPVSTMDGRWSDQEQFLISGMLGELIAGDAPAVESQLAAFVDKTQVDEVMLSCTVYDQAARLRSYEIAAAAFGGLSEPRREFALGA
jgi:luciferase family oxidoreductase group 1